MKNIFKSIIGWFKLIAVATELIVFVLKNNKKKVA